MANIELPLNNLYNLPPLFSKDGVSKAYHTEYFLSTVKKSSNKNAMLCQRRCGEKGIFLYCW